LARAQLVHLLLAAALLGCRTAAPSDAEAYLSGDCPAIGEPALRGECVSFAAAARARGGDRDGAFADCASLRPHPAADECHFLVVDTLGLGRAEAATACAGAGRYRDRCRGHAVRRDAAGALAAAGPGNERAAWMEIARWPGVGPGRARALVVDLLAARATASLALEPSVCGDAPTELCADALTEAGRRSTAARDALCAASAAGPLDWQGAVDAARVALGCAPG